MARTASLMIPLQTPAPAFSLINAVDDNTVSYPNTDFAHATVIMFICNHCPYVKLINHKLVEVAKSYQAKQVNFIAISANDPESYPDDSFENMKITAASEGYSFPYLFDANQQVAKAYQAVCTPDFFIFNEQHLLVYRGQFDDARPGNHIEVTGESLSHALDCILAGKTISETQKPSIGCNIKWK